MIAALLLVLGLAGVALGVWARTVATRSSFRPEAPEGAPVSSFPSTYGDEIEAALLRLPPLHRSTLYHLRRQDMQTFVGDRHSLVLQALEQRNLLHPMGSSAFPLDAYPYRVPDEVWTRLAPATEPTREPDAP